MSSKCLYQARVLLKPESLGLVNIEHSMKIFSKRMGAIMKIEMNRKIKNITQLYGCYPRNKFRSLITFKCW